MSGTPVWNEREPPAPTTWKVRLRPSILTGTVLELLLTYVAVMPVTTKIFPAGTTTIGESYPGFEVVPRRASSQMKSRGSGRAELYVLYGRRRVGRERGGHLIVDGHERQRPIGSESGSSRP